jgi:hypothetical protein
MSFASKPVRFSDIPLAIIVGNAFDVLLCNEEAEPVTSLSNSTGQEVTVVHWNKNNGASLQ